MLYKNRHHMETNAVHIIKGVYIMQTYYTVS